MIIDDIFLNFGWSGTLHNYTNYNVMDAVQRQLKLSEMNRAVAGIFRPELQYNSDYTRYQVNSSPSQVLSASGIALAR